MCCCVVALRRFLGYEAGICDKARDLDADDARYDELSRRARAAAADARARSAVDAGAATEGPSLTARVAAANHARVRELLARALRLVKLALPGLHSRLERRALKVEQAHGTAAEP